MASVGAYDWSGGFQGYSSNGLPTFEQDKEFVKKDSYLGKKHFQSQPSGFVVRELLRSVR